ncbi:3-phosphoserine/phosphohydroxythreonine transaminase [Niveibacterium sp. 24ML]|uniref:3-phosphoserine/phosphohydroxythreonine transaminase n=1 Tax=Niveibacterium sp. 24ML TaxID=2985512 RepID=UPI002270C9FC|nr:3-phosphoserine/phosphohydroxythreonine transaminase [Niveibacterium sp. 24ML]MCX9156029.1 3-phosphoserine/phosphohydroxythreonine transaminase [Niveibacterium sp. 24ML]
MTRPWNFGAGPATLPEAVLRQVAGEMLDWHGSGMSVMEMSHRGKEFMAIIEQAEADLRDLMAVPSNYKILFMQGGAIAENAIIPLNLAGKNQKIDFIETGSWTTKSLKEARRYGDVHIAASSLDPAAKQGKYTCIPSFDQWRLRSDAAYLHLCSNETIDGVEFFDWPDMAALGAPDVPVVADVSSDILSRPLDVSRFGLLFGGAQKNIGPAGLTIVIVRDDLLDQSNPLCPLAFQYKTVAENGSMFNTPPTFPIYIAGLVFQWLKQQGGVEAVERTNIAKAKLLYDALDASDLYVCHVDPSVRSRMNVPFFLRDESLNDAFLVGAKARGLLQLKGHKSVGGMRASIYNAMPLEGVQALVDYLREFEQTRA